MFWDHLVYRVIQHGRNKRIEENTKMPEFSGVLHSFIDRNYFSNSLIRIRRLIESEKSIISGAKGVFSLRSLIKDIKKNQPFLSREIYFELNELPYDYESVRKQEIQYILSQPPTDDECFTKVPPEYYWQNSYNSHLIFDRLSGTELESRRKDDLMQLRIFDGLLRKLDSVDPVLTHANKFIAHNATPESRLANNDLHTQVLVNDIWKAQSILYSVANFLAVVIFSVDISPLPYAHISFYKNWESPLFRKNEREEIRLEVEKYRNEIDEKHPALVNEMWVELET